MKIVNVHCELIPKVNGNNFYPNDFLTYAHYIKTNINSGSKCFGEIAPFLYPTTVYDFTTS